MRYLVIKEADLVKDVKILLRSDDKESVETFVQNQQAKDVRVYQLRYVAENVLCSVGYEDEMHDNADKATES